MHGSSRVILNTGVQYIRTLFSLIISLYTTRLVLDGLGVDDYGIYSLVGGIVAMLSFIRSSMSSTTIRYLSFHKGRNDLQMQKKIFNNTYVTQLIFSISLVLVLIIAQPFLFSGFLNIPIDRLNAAQWVYAFMVITLFFTMQSIPYYATLISHENIVYSTIIQIIEISLKLPIALSLSIAPIDKLIYYSFLLFLIQVLEFVSYYLYCKQKYPETRYIKIWHFDKQVFKEMFSFMGWVVYSTGCVVGRTQGIAILLNKFYGSAINAAYGIAWRFTGQLSFLSTSLMNAINPQIIKAEGENDRKRMLRLSEIGSKFSFFLLAMISIPTIIEMDSILTLWLKKVPEHTVVFSQFIVLTNLADQLTIGLVTANKAIGRIRNYSLFINTIKLITVPVSLVCLWLGLSLISVMVSLFVFELICALARLPFLYRTGGLSIKGFSKRVFLLEIIPIGTTLFICYTFSTSFNFPWRFLITYFISFFVLLTSSYFFGLCQDERIIINKFITKGLIKFNIVKS